MRLVRRADFQVALCADRNLPRFFTRDVNSKSMISNDKELPHDDRNPITYGTSRQVAEK